MPLFAAAALPAIIGGGVAAGGAIAGGALGASAAGHAANTQAQAAEDAAILQQQNANAALGFNEQQLNLAQQNTAATRGAGQNATIALNDLMGLSPVAPQPINVGGNTAPQAGGFNSPAVPGSIANPPAPGPAYPGAPMPPQPAAAPAPTVPMTSSVPPWMNDNPRFQNPHMYGRAQGGPTHMGIHYLVGEKGPEELVMHPDGTGHVIPHVVSWTQDLIHRGAGGPVYSATPQQGMNGQGQPLTLGGNLGGGRPGPQGNPLVTGGNAPGAPSQLNPFQSWTMPFQAPTGAQAAQEPGYQFQLQQGIDALKNQASAGGELGDSNYGRGLVNYAQGAAQSDYGNVYNRALQQYQQAYNIFNGNQTNQFNRLADIAGMGQTSTNQLNAGGYQMAGNTGNVLLGSGQQIGQNLNNAAAATASGYVGGANAWGGALGNIGNNVSQYMTLQQILGQQQQPGQPAGYGTV